MRRVRRRAAMVWPYAVALFGLLLNMTGQTLIGGAAVRNERSLDLRAQEFSITQFARSERSLQGFAETGEDLSSVGAALFHLHGGWSDSGQSDWSAWQAPESGACDLAITAFCWQARLGAIDVQTARAGVEHEQRSLLIRVISGCFETSLPPTNATAAEISRICESVSTSQSLYRKRSFLHYGLHIGQQQASPRQAIIPGLQPIIDASLDLDTSDVPFHTNDPTILVCTHGNPAEWPQLGQIVEVSETNPPHPRHAGVAVGTAFTSPLDAFDVLGGSTGPCWPSGFTRAAALGAAPAGTAVVLSQPLRVVREAVETDAAAQARCAAASPAPPEWLAPAAATAVRIGQAVTAGGTFDLATAADGQVIYSTGNITLTGNTSPGSSVTVAAGGSITVQSDTIGPGTTSGVLALIVGCDIILADPTGGDPSIGLVSGNWPTGHNITLQRVAVLAPQGSVFPAAHDRPPNVPTTFPTVSIEGAIATRWIGVFGTHDPSGQITGYDLALTYPADFADEVPPWWPDPLGGAWQPVG